MILDQIAADTRLRVEAKKKEISLEEVKRDAQSMEKNTGFPFETALRKPDLSFICEAKKASPSKGIIAEEFPYLQIAKEYDEAGADAISCLTEPKYFLGKDEYLKEIAKEVKIPVLRKDFVVDEYQIYEAENIRCKCCTFDLCDFRRRTVKSLSSNCKSLVLSALVEAHDEKEIKQAVRVGAKIIGVNNRNLKDFSVNVGNSTNLRNFVPPEILFVAESGIKGPEEIKALRKNKVDAVLIGETMMRSPDKAKMLRFLKGEEHHEES